MTNTQKISLLVKDDYRCRKIHHPRGTIIEVTREESDFLFRDAPGCFEVFDPESPEHAAEIAATNPPESEHDQNDQERVNRFWDSAVKACPDKSEPGATYNSQS